MHIGAHERAGVNRLVTMHSVSWDTRVGRPLAFLIVGLFAVALVPSPTAISTPVDEATRIGAPIPYCRDPDTDPTIDTGTRTMITCGTTVTDTIGAIDPATGVASDAGVRAITATVDGADSVPAGFPWLPLSFVWFVGAIVVSARVWRRDRRMSQRGFAEASPIA
jgi:hypothetical protein